MISFELSEIDMFECCLCKERSDDPEEYTYPLEELANPEETDTDHLICHTCYLDGIHDKICEGYDEIE